MVSPIERIESYFVQVLGRPVPDARLRRLTVKKRAISLLYGVFRGLTDEELALRSMSLVYTTLLSIVPLLAFAFSVLKAFGAHTRFEIFLYYLLEPMGEKGVDLSMKVIGFVENINVSVLGSIGLAMLVYTVISQIQKIEGSLNYIWNIRSSRSITRRFSNYLSVLLIGPVLIFSAIGITASLMSSTVVKSIMSEPRFGTFTLFFGMIIPYLMASAAFVFVYLFLPNTKVRASAAIAGGLFAGAAWKFMGWAFAHFVASSAQYSAIYSGFAILILSLIWIYWCWFTLLLGARVAYSFQYPLVRASHAPLAPAQREYAGLAVMVLITRNFLEGKPGVQFNALTQRLGVPIYEIQSLIELFQKSGYVVATDSDPVTFVPAQDPSNITLGAILKTVREGRESGGLSPERDAVPAVHALMQKIDAGMHASVESSTLRDLASASQDR